MDKLALTCSSAFLLVVLLFLRFVHGAKMITSCSQTPYPEVCYHFINTNPLPSQLDEAGRLEFHELVHKVAINQAIEVHRLISVMDLSPFNEQAKLAWTDCLELYEDTVIKLNRSMSSNNPTDSLTWISASIANEQTCQNSVIDFSLSSHVQSFPNMLRNFSNLLSNTLAIKKAAALSSTSRPTSKQFGGRRLLSDDFPTWVSVADRRLLQSSGAAPEADFVVSQDGSGDYSTISEAVTASASRTKRFIIYVKAGVYKENVEINKPNIMITGDGIDATIVTGNRNVQGGSTTFRSATFAISGDRFIARDITFENTAGPQNNQAVALRAGGDFSIFFRCSFKSYQDTLYVFSQRQFYRDCDIYGTQDFIFGDAVAVLQNCNIYVRKPSSGQKNTVTAQARTDPNENTGIIVQNSLVTAASDLRPVQASFETYLGRPWQKYSRTVFMKNNIDSLINPAGWLPWSGSFALSTLYYGEYMNTGSGANTAGRVKWPGYHVITSSEEAARFTVGNFLAGDSWIPGNGVPFSGGL
ncbi:putative pectinesterase/pectinesterase inhibitor 6 [Morella rubra]|uniref:Putative pectinesterase/pectinesterase inhibitor 6 n=1 Tax=Morella rubra TaxID=262757 RepID=A0A6A1UZG0_9ROSI|nr:putative pectinesterase/pectinesterase inhibitor 6 [Morella rubra]